MKTNIEVTLSKIMAYAAFAYGVYKSEVLELMPYIVILVTGKQAFDYLKSNNPKP